jgi:hypothetical protein
MAKRNAPTKKSRNTYASTLIAANPTGTSTFQLPNSSSTPEFTPPMIEEHNCYD